MKLIIGGVCGVLNLITEFLGLFTTHNLSAALCTQPGFRARQPEFKVVCYLQTASFNKTGTDRFSSSDINPRLCTHINVAFGTIKDGVLVAKSGDLPGPGRKGYYEQVTDLKKKNPTLKVLLSVAAGDNRWIATVATETSRRKFAAQATTFLSNYSFDGVDLDWEFPSNKMKESYTLFLKEMRERFDQVKSSTGKEFLLTVATSAIERQINTSYDVPRLSQYVDFVNMMGYDYYSWDPPWEEKTGIHSPLYPPADHKPYDIKYQAYSVQYWLSQGCPASKLILGMGLYGRTFTLEDPREHGVGANATGAGTPGGGWRSYRDIVTDIKAGWSWVYRDDMKACYSYHGNQWVGFDNPQSIGEKAEYVRQQKFGGAMVWSMDQDDFTGAHSGGQKLPMLTKINIVLNRNKSNS